MYLKNIQALRGIAALLVVGLHLILFGNQKYGLNAPQLNELAHLFKIGVDIFFVISGFVMIVTTSRTAKGGHSALKFIARRITRIYPVYWFVSFLLMPIFLFRPNWINSGDSIASSLLHSFLLFPHEGTPLLMVGWTLEYEMFFYIVYALSLLIFPARWRLHFLALWALSGVGIGLVYSFSAPLAQLATSPFLLEFLAGAILGHLYVSDKYFAPPPWWITFLAVSIPVLMMQDWLFKVHRVAMFLLPATICVYLALVAERRYACTLNKKWQYLGDISYPLYLIHIPAISAVGKVWIALEMDGSVLTGTTMLAVKLGVCIISAMVLHHIVELPTTVALRHVMHLRLHGAIKKMVGR